MRALMIALVVLLAAVAVAAWLQPHAGYLVLSVAGWRIETSLIFAVLAVAVVLVVLQVLWVLLDRTVGLPKVLSHWSTRRRKEKARGEMAKGLLALAEGRYRSGEDLLLKHVERSDYPLINYLGAALCAQRRHAEETRDSYLALAEQTAGGSGSAVQLLQAQLYMESGQWEQALASLTSAYERNPNHPRTLEMMRDCCVALEDWERLGRLLKPLRKKGIIGSEEAEDYARYVARDKIRRAARIGLGDLESTWSRLPRAQRNDDELVLTHAEALLDLDEIDRAAAVLKGRIDETWDERLVLRFGALEQIDPEWQMQQLKRWLRQQPDNAALLYVAGRVALRLRDWDRARDYLEQALARRARPEVYMALGALLEFQDRPDDARELYRKALGMVSEGMSSDLPELPVPRTLEGEVRPEDEIAIQQTGEEDPVALRSTT